MNDVIDVDGTTIQLGSILELAVDVWRIRRRALREASTPQPVIGACDRAMETLNTMGLDIQDLVGQSYSGNMLVQLIHDEGGSGRRVISECLSPAVYFHETLVKRAEVVVKGEACDENADG